MGFEFSLNPLKCSLTFGTLKFGKIGVLVNFIIELLQTCSGFFESVSLVAGNLRGLRTIKAHFPRLSQENV